MTEGTTAASAARELRIEYMRLDQIRRDPTNPKDHDLGALAESLERFGFVALFGGPDLEPVVVRFQKVS